MRQLLTVPVLEAEVDVVGGERLLDVPPSKYGTYETVTARFWRWLEPLTDYHKVDMLGSWYKSINFGAYRCSRLRWLPDYHKLTYWLRGKNPSTFGDTGARGGRGPWRTKVDIIPKS